MESRYWDIPAPYIYDSSVYGSSVNMSGFVPTAEYLLVVDSVISGIAMPVETETGWVNENSVICEDYADGSSEISPSKIIGWASNAWNGIPASWDSDTWDTEDTWTGKMPVAAARISLTLTEVS
jgi:hypothetical protein